MNRVLRDSYAAYVPRPFTAAERDRTTIAFGGMTWRTERALQGLFSNCGYRSLRLPSATREDLLKGRELIDNGQCCPMAFTTGALVNFLERQVETVGSAAAVNDYIYVTLGACGACRFRQYHQSYELALRNLGLEDFRLFFVQQDEIDQSREAGAGLQTDTHMLLGAVMAIVLSDLVQDLEYQIRPYEIEPGATERAARRAMEEIHDALANRPKRSGQNASILWHLTTGYFAGAMRRARKPFEQVRLDRLQPKPKVKITGEFYLATVEGEQNYNMHSWLESESAEVYPAGVSIYLDYLMRFARQSHEARIGLRRNARLNAAVLRLASRLFNMRYNQHRRAFGGVAHALPGQDEVSGLAAPFYDNLISGGEGDLLIGKAIWTHLHRQAHMICELSPYGCLPNTMSIGAMANVLGHYPDLLYAPIEIKGDAEVHALSRCQMVLTEAKTRARDEFDRALKAAGLSLDEARARMARRPEMASPFWKVPDRGAVGTAANVVLELGGARLS